MIFKIKNFGKITDANIKLDGITVICGNNNTGKSTVGKALFAFFNALFNYKRKINEQKYDIIISSLINSPDYVVSIFDIMHGDKMMDFISSHDNFTPDEVDECIKSNFSLSLTKDRLESVVKYLNTPDADVLSEYVHRYFASVMNGQIKNVYSASRSLCSVSGEFKGFTNTITFRAKKSICVIGEPIEHSAYYINTPFSLDSLNDLRTIIRGSSPMSRSAIEAIQNAQAAINEDSMTNILDTVMNKKDLDAVREIIKKAYSGDTIIDHGKYYYTENGRQFDFRNISAGLKSFAIIERMLETGVLKRKDVLILDEPEIHLHTEWQIIYAELIVILQKAFDLTILLVTHSFQFLESLNFFMKKYEISDRGNYYMPIQDKKGVKILDSTDNLTNMKKNLKSGMHKLADMMLDETIDGDSDEENYE